MRAVAIVLWAVSGGPVSQLGLDGLNSPENEIAIAVSGDGGEAWLERRAGVWGEPGSSSRLLHVRRDTTTGGWQEPTPAPFALTGHAEGDPFFDEATATLYFTSDRPHPTLADSGADIWRVRRIDERWGEPQALPPPINGPGAEYSPVRRGDHLYFASYRDGGGDIYVAEESAGGWQVRKLGPAINAPSGEWNVWVSPNEELMLFEASGRPTNVTVSGDLYASVTDSGGRWLPAVPLADLNGPGSDLNARVVDDEIVYASSSLHPTHTDLYTAPLVAVLEPVSRAYRYRLHVASRSSHEVVAIDLAGGNVAGRVSIGPGPHLLAAHHDRLAVAAYGIFPRPHHEPVDQMPGWVEERGGSLLVMADEPWHSSSGCERPHGSAWDDRGERLWVSCEDRLGVVEIDFRVDPPARRLLTTGQPGAHVVAWDAGHEQLLVAHTDAGGVAFVRPDVGGADFVTIAPGTEALWIDDDREEAWVTIGPSGQIAILDLGRRVEVARLEPDCGFPIDFASGSDGRLWLACFVSSELLAFAPGSREVTERLSLPAGPLNIEAHPTLPVIYASLPRRNQVVEISLSGPGVTRSFEAGIEPDGLALVPLPE